MANHGLWDPAWVDALARDWGVSRPMVWRTRQIMQMAMAEEMAAERDVLRVQHILKIQAAQEAARTAGPKGLGTWCSLLALEAKLCGTDQPPAERVPETGEEMDRAEAIRELAGLPASLLEEALAAQRERDAR